VLASAKEENVDAVDREEGPLSEPTFPVLFCELPLLKTLLAFELAEKGVFLLMRMRWVLPGMEDGCELFDIMEK